MRYEIKKLHKKAEHHIYLCYPRPDRSAYYGDKIVILNEGKIQQAGSAEDIFNYPSNTFVATFMGNMPMNIIPANINDGILCFDRVMVTLSDFNRKLLGIEKRF